MPSSTRCIKYPRSHGSDTQLSETQGEMGMEPRHPSIPRLIDLQFDHYPWKLVHKDAAEKRQFLVRSFSLMCPASGSYERVAQTLPTRQILQYLRMRLVGKDHQWSFATFSNAP
ncbi:hypothetical protein CVT26_005776 [Gymnopilus dilepis]|uniref:Uncharacterized protein n=1 Tax=Gymnopilus dilepis TaxID=231916 RepID=A0A409VPH9_9AGAR|nr:hypothetical protein CVT26_005776 [Gymnopilus dilepis]